MRKAFALILTTALAASFLSSFGQFKGLTGDKAAEEQKKLEEEKKKQLDEMAAQVAAKLAEDAKKAEEEQKKREAEINTEVEKRLAEKEAEAKKAAETQPQAKKDEPVKVVERVIVKEPAKTPDSKPNPAEQVAQKLSGYVRLYDDAGFTDRILTVRFGRDIGNMHYVSSDDGKAGFNDKASSVKYSVPDGYQAVLYENNNYAKRGYVLKGTGSIADLGYFGDKCSSLRWEKAQ